MPARVRKSVDAMRVDGIALVASLGVKGSLPPVWEITPPNLPVDCAGQWWCGLGDYPDSPAPKPQPLPLPVPLSSEIPGSVSFTQEKLSQTRKVKATLKPEKSDGSVQTRRGPMHGLPTRGGLMHEGPMYGGQLHEEGVRYASRPRHAAEGWVEGTSFSQPSLILEPLGVKVAHALKSLPPADGGSVNKRSLENALIGLSVYSQILEQVVSVSFLLKSNDQAEQQSRPPQHQGAQQIQGELQQADRVQAEEQPADQLQGDKENEQDASSQETGVTKILTPKIVSSLLADIDLATNKTFSQVSHSPLSYCPCLCV